MLLVVGLGEEGRNLLFPRVAPEFVSGYKPKQTEARQSTTTLSDCVLSLQDET